MRILVHDFAGHPFQAQLSRELSRRGHRVLHAYCGGVTTGRGDLDRRADDPEPLNFVDCSTGDFERYDPVRRIKSEVTYGRAVSAVARSFAPEVVISANTPLLAQATLWRTARRIGARRVFWLQDFLGRGTRAVLTGRSPLLGATAGATFERLETQLLRGSDAVIAISDDFIDALDARGVTVRRTVIENWAPLDELPVRAKTNSWSVAHGLADRPVALYSGTLGLKHDPEHILRAAEVVGDVGEVVVVTEGRGREVLEAARTERGLENLHLFDFVPYDTLPDLLATADLAMVLLEPDAGMFSVPSKVLSYLCAGRAVVAAVPAENLAARVLVRSGAGWLATPGDHDGFAAHVRRALCEPSTAAHMGESGRSYAENRFEITRIADEVLELVAGSVATSEADSPTGRRL
jgi:glycosyltransferase involved in cell wall biosynthesis